MKKIFLLFNFLFKSKYKFFLPPKKTIIIYDEYSMSTFEKIFNVSDFYVLHIRQNIIYPIILLKSFFIYKFKWNINKYNIEIINFIEPKIIITHNDNDSFFWKLKNYVNNDIKTIFVQNGYRSYSLDIFEIMDKMKFNKSENNIDYFFVFSESIKNKYLEYLNGQGIVLGSFRNNRKSIKKDYKNKKDILFISEFASPKNFTPPCDLEKYWKPENFHLPIIKKFALENNLSLKILGKKNRDPRFRKEENIFLEKILGKENWQYLETNYSYECYEKLDNSKFVVFISSTLGYEAISRGIPTAALCTRKIFKDQKDFNFAWPYKFENKNSFVTNIHSEKETSKILEYVNNIEKEKWIESTKNLKIHFMHYDKNNSSFFEVLNKLEIPYNKNNLELNSDMNIL